MHVCKHCVWCFFTETWNNLVSYYFTDLQKQTSYSASVTLIQDFLLIWLVIHTVNWPALCEHKVNVKCCYRDAPCLNKIWCVEAILFRVLKLPAVLLHPRNTQSSQNKPMSQYRACPRGQCTKTILRRLQTTSHMFHIVHVFSSSQSFRAPLERNYSPEQLKQHGKVGTCKY